eukprot:COSAG01_NODE_39407_length_477_cov_0.539683_1_plen_23_part_10
MRRYHHWQFAMEAMARVGPIADT